MEYKAVLPANPQSSSSEKVRLPFVTLLTISTISLLVELRVIDMLDFVKRVEVGAYKYKTSSIHKKHVQQKKEPQQPTIMRQLIDSKKPPCMYYHVKASLYAVNQI